MYFPLSSDFVSGRKLKKERNKNWLLPTGSTDITSETEHSLKSFTQRISEMYGTTLTFGVPIFEYDSCDD